MGNLLFPANLFIPENAKGIIVFSHGSGSSRLSPRNLAVAQYLQGKGFGTLLFDLLTREEGSDPNYRFEVGILSQRLSEATQWLHRFTAPEGLPVGYFGASTGAAAALRAAALQPGISAIVSRGGRPDLALDYLRLVKAPTMLIVGSLDTMVVSYNQEAYYELACKKSLIVVDGATHLFEEEGTLEQVCAVAGDWFEQNMKAKSQYHV